MRLRHLMAAAAILVFALAAKADSFNFTFTPSTAGLSQGLSALSFTLDSKQPFSNPNSVSFTFQNVTVISGGTQSSDFISFGNTGFFEFAAGSTAASINANNTINASGYPNAYIFTSGQIFTGAPTNPNFQVGSYTGGTGTLLITQAQTPEPSTFALLGTGLFGVIGAARRRFVA